MTSRSHRAVVTGGAGFIGSNIVERFVAAGLPTLVVDDLSRGKRENLPAGVELVVADVASPEAVLAIAEFAADRVIHCAAQPSVPGSFEDPLEDARSNIVGTINVLLASADSPATRFVYVTTGGALFGGEMRAPWSEADEPTPISPYGLSKLTAERYVELLAGSRVATSLRLANVYGPRQGAVGEAAVVAAFVARMLAGDPVTIDGDGEQTRDLVYVGDVVDAVEAAIASDRSGVYHVGTGAGTSVNTLYRELAAITGYAQPPRHGPGRVGDIRHSALDPSRARRELGWSARTGLRQGLEATVADQVARRGGTGTAG